MAEPEKKKLLIQRRLVLVRWQSLEYKEGICVVWTSIHASRFKLNYATFFAPRHIFFSIFFLEKK